MRFPILLTTAFIALSGCSAMIGGTQNVQLGPDGKPLPKVYHMPRDADAKIPYEIQDAVNALRAASNEKPVHLNAALTAAAATHSHDMSNQNRPWHFGSDGSSPIDRVQRVGYKGHLIGEDISETYETEMETLAAWMDDKDTRNVIMDPRATDLGFAWYQDQNGKLWWTLLTGTTVDNPATDPDH